MLDFRLDDREFRRALQQYLDETKKDLAHVVNRSALNVTIKASLSTPPAERSKITSLPQKEWWPKYVAKRLRGAGVKIGRGKTRKTIKGAFTTKQARQASRAIIQSRLKRTGWLKAGWIPALRKLNLLVRGFIGAAMRGTANIKNPRGDARAAVAGINPTAVIVNASASDQASLRRIQNGLQTGMNLAAADMLKYLRERAQRTADRFSGRR